MKSVVFDEKEIENIGKSDKIKYCILGLVIPIGLILSLVLAYLNIDFTELSKIFNENLTNPELLYKLAQVTKKWYIISLAIVLVVFLFLAIYIYIIYNKEQDKEDTLTWGQTIFLTIELVLIFQIILPLFVLIGAIVIPLLYLVLFVSVPLKNILGYGTYCFVWIIERFCTSSEITLTYGEFIGQERYSIFLTMITFLVLAPYLLSFLLRIIKKFIRGITGNEFIVLIFKLIEVLVNVNVLRYIIYIILFFTSIFTYSINISESDYVFSLVKEALLEFVLLDTVIYSIISNLKGIRLKHKQRNIRRYYTPFKYDLELVLFAITIYNLKSKEIHSCIKFSIDLKGKKQKSVKEIHELLIDISENRYEIEILEQKIKIVLNRIIDLIE